jgi:hypothetical protein
MVRPDSWHAFDLMVVASTMDYRTRDKFRKLLSCVWVENYRFKSFDGLPNGIYRMNFASVAN